MVIEIVIFHLLIALLAFTLKHAVRRMARACAWTSQPSAVVAPSSLEGVLLARILKEVHPIISASLTFSSVAFPILLALVLALALVVLQVQLHLLKALLASTLEHVVRRTAKACASVLRTAVMGVSSFLGGVLSAKVPKYVLHIFRLYHFANIAECCVPNNSGNSAGSSLGIALSMRSGSAVTVGASAGFATSANVEATMSSNSISTTISRSITSTLTASQTTNTASSTSNMYHNTIAQTGTCHSLNPMEGYSGIASISVSAYLVTSERNEGKN